MMRLADANDQMRNSRKQTTVCLEGMLLASVASLIFNNRDKRQAARRVVVFPYGIDINLPKGEHSPVTIEK